MAKTFSVLDLCGQHCIDLEAADKLYWPLYTALSEGHSVKVDFSGVKTVVALFLTSAIGHLFQCFSNLDERLTVVGLPEESTFVYERVMGHAKRYAKDKTYRFAIDALMARMAK